MPGLPVIQSLSLREREGAAQRRKGEGDKGAFVRTYHRQPSGTVSRARQLRRDATDAERALWLALRENFPAARFRRQVPIGPYYADFLSHSARLIIEVDGGQHNEQIAYDNARTAFLNAEGYRVIRFWNCDVLGSLEAVVEQIAANLPSPLVGEGGAQRRMRGVRHRRTSA